MTAPALPVLMYHGVHAERTSRGVFDLTYSVTPGMLARQLDLLRDTGWSTVRLSGGTPARSVVLTFDDGDVSTLDVAVPMLLERGMCAEFFVPSDYVGRSGRLTVGDLAALVSAGMGVQSHGRSHRCLADLSATELREELATSKEALERWAGAPVAALSLPGGRGAAREMRVAHELGYRHVLNSVPGPNRHRGPDRYLQRVSITRSTALEDFAMLVEWRGPAARRSAMRTTVLEVGKQVLGNARYERVRSRIRAT